MTREIFDLDLFKHRRSRYGLQDDSFYDDIAPSLLTRLDLIKRDFESILLFGFYTELLQDDLKQKYPKATITIQDWIPNTDGGLSIEPKSYDLILSAGVLQFINDLPGALIQIHQGLKPDGLFLGMIVGEDSLSELRDVFLKTESHLLGGVSPRIMPMTTTQQASSLLQRAGFALPVADKQTLHLAYPDLKPLIRDLRQMGGGNILTDRLHRPMTKKFYQSLEQTYRDHYQDSDGLLPLSVDLIFLTGWSPDASQQQPARRGSATTSLADALGTSEIKTGDKAGV